MQDQQGKLDPVRFEVAWDRTTQSNYELKYFNFTRIQKCYARVAYEAATACHFKNLTMRLQFTLCTNYKQKMSRIDFLTMTTNFFIFLWFLHAFTLNHF